MLPKSVLQKLVSRRRCRPVPVRWKHNSDAPRWQMLLEDSQTCQRPNTYRRRHRLPLAICNACACVPMAFPLSSTSAKWFGSALRVGADRRMGYHKSHSENLFAKAFCPGCVLERSWTCWQELTFNMDDDRCQNLEMKPWSLFANALVFEEVKEHGWM